MPCIWGEFSNSQIILNVGIFPVDFIAKAKVGTAASLDVFPALLDTGAQTTCITKNVAEKVGLDPIGKVPVQGVSGVADHNNYLFLLGFVFGNPKKKQASGTAHIVETPIQGAELAIEGGKFEVLLGMDVISMGSLSVQGNGHFSFSF